MQVYDVGEDNFPVNRYFLGSGLLIASKYPVVAAAFQPYSCACFSDKLACKGCLVAKVSLDSGGKLVGYVCNTHLQAHDDPLAESVRLAQLGECKAAIARFVQVSGKPPSRTAAPPHPFLSR